MIKKNTKAGGIPLNKQNAADFSQGSIGSRIMAQAIPLSLAEIVQLLYNIVDRIFLGHLPDGNTLALTGVGLIFPVVSIVAAFTSLYSSGGAPIFAMARGRKDEERALQIQGTVFALLLGSSLALTVLCYLLKRPLLFLFGAREDSFVFADAYLKIYLLGTPFTMLATGMNPFINAQGRPKIGMMTTVIGAVLNLALDPLFIYGFNMGVTGAAVATVISQAVSCIWVLRFLSGPKSILPLRRREARIYPYLLKDILSLGVVGFIMKFTNSLVQIACNKMLSIHGGDLYVGVMTVINAIRDVFTLPASGITDGARPVLSYNYGAGQMQRVRAGIRFMSAAAMVYTFCACEDFLTQENPNKIGSLRRTRRWSRPACGCCACISRASSSRASSSAARASSSRWAGRNTPSRFPCCARWSSSCR